MIEKDVSLCCVGLCVCVCVSDSDVVTMAIIYTNYSYLHDIPSDGKERVSERDRESTCNIKYPLISLTRDMLTWT